MIAEQFDSLSWAADVTWDLGDLHFQSEWITNQKAYTAEGRTMQQSFTLSLTPSDFFSWSGYALIGYRLPWFGIMPFVLVDRAFGIIYHTEVKHTDYGVGLNIRPVDVLVIKLQFDHVAQEGEGLDDINVFSSQLAWAF